MFVATNKAFTAKLYAQRHCYKIISYKIVRYSVALQNNRRRIIATKSSSL